LFDEKREFAISAGLTLMDIRFGIFGNGSQGVIEADTDLTAPLPAIGLTGGYAFTENLYVKADAGFFLFDLAVSDETDLRGNVATASAGVYHNTFKHVRFGLTFNYYDVDRSITMTLTLTGATRQDLTPFSTLTMARL